MKPREKTVTVADIESCLYYVHVYGAEDEKLRQALLSESNQSIGHIAFGREQRIQGGEAVRRNSPKPESNAHFDTPTSLPPKIFPFNQSPTTLYSSGPQVVKKPVGWQMRPTVARSMESPTDYSPPRLVGPRPMNQRPQSADNNVLQPSPERLNIDIKRLGQPPDDSPLLRPRPQRKPLHRPDAPERVEDGAEDFPHIAEDLHPDTTSGLQQDTKTSNSSYEQEFSLILIRRYANMQWNVGNISRLSAVTRSDNLNNTNHASSAETSQDGIFIEIPTAGYAKFAEKEPQTNGKENLSPAQKISRPMHIQNHGQFPFERRIQVANFNKVGSQRRVVENSSESSMSKQHRFSSKFKLHRHSQYMKSNERVERLPLQLSPTQPAVDPRGYTFRSPWGGVCEFNVGFANRSFKCRHISSPSRTHSTKQIQPTSVSELRFNLPSSKSLSASPPRKSKTWRSSASSRHNSLDSPTSETSGDFSWPNDDRLDLSLGQEHAGGGFGGKQAKLGKLIIENEGLKMLDILVAANIGIWWRVYENTYFRPERSR